MDDRFRIRAATPADAVRIAELERVCFPDPWSPAGITEVLEADQCFGCVVEDAGVVIGYALARWVADTGEILNLAVAPEYRRQGLARALLDAALSRLGLKGAREVYLEVRASNTRAQALYQLRGFRLVGMRPAYYRHPVEDALVLRLALAGPA